MNYEAEAEGRSPLRTAGRAIAVAGAIASVGLTLWVGRGGSSLILMVPFVGWVLGPFVGLLVTDRLSRGWAPLARATLYIIMLVVPAASVALYGDVAVRPRATPAAMFLVVPLCSWLLMVVVIGIAVFVSRKRLPT